MNSFSFAKDEAKELAYSQAVILSVTDDVGVSFVMDILLESCRAKDVASRLADIFFFKMQSISMTDLFSRAGWSVVKSVTPLA